MSANINEALTEVKAGPGDHHVDVQRADVLEQLHVYQFRIGLQERCHALSAKGCTTRETVASNNTFWKV
eukprot:scaffold132381_cov21-Prasinocladus_malaysianus.AAC.1